MLGKPRILSLYPNSFNKFIKHEHSCKILYSLSLCSLDFDLRYSKDRIRVTDVVLLKYCYPAWRASLSVS